MKTPIDIIASSITNELLYTMIYSVFKLSTGFAIAAFIALMLTVTSVNSMAEIPAITNIHHLMFVR